MNPCMAPGGPYKLLERSLHSLKRRLIRRSALYESKRAQVWVVKASCGSVCLQPLSCGVSSVEAATPCRF